MFTFVQILPQTILFRFCMVCGRFMGLRDGQGVRGISHGICPECFKKWEKKRKERNRKDNKE